MAFIVVGIHLGYYKGSKSGKWCVKIRNQEGKYEWQTIGLADDHFEANNKTILNYSQAQERAKKIGDKIRLGSDEDETQPYTVQKAVEDYLADFKANGKKSEYATETQINAHILPTKKIILFLSVLINSSVHAFEYNGPGSQSYTQQQEQQYWQAQQQANANATAQGWTSSTNNPCGTNGCSGQADAYENQY